MKAIPVGITYASFAGLCIVATVLVGVFKFNQTPNLYTNIGLALITLVQVATYDDWAAIMGQVTEVYPYAWIFFVSFNKIDLMNFRNFVKISLTELDELVALKGLTFGMDTSKYKLDKE